MNRRRIKKRYYKAKNTLKLFALVAFAGIVIALFQSFFVHINAKEKITITEFSLPTSGSYPVDITSGPDGNLWFTEGAGNKIGRITPQGNITEFSIPTVGGSPYGITSGPDGNLWFTDVNGNKIGRITPQGNIAEFVIPTLSSAPFDITAGPDGNIWFTEFNGNKIGKITSEGTIVEYPIPTSGSGLWGITVGPDNNIWFTEVNGNKIGRITSEGNIIEFTLPTSFSSPEYITSGPDGNIWFTEVSENKIGRITPQGNITEFPIPTDASYPRGIASGPDGNLWFTQYYGNKIGRITPDGTIAEFEIPTEGSYPEGIASGSDGNIWFTENQANKIGRVNLADQKGPDRDFALLSPFNNGVMWTVSSGYYNNRNQTSTGCHIGLGPDHCRNQLFGLDMVPDQQNDTDILAPGNGKVEFTGKLEDEDCIGMRITLDNGLNLNVCHFASFNVNQGERVVQGKVLGIRSTPHVHLSLDDRYRIGTLCPGKDRCFLPVPFDGQHTLEGMSFDPNPNGETVSLPYPLCDERKVDCQFEVDFQQYQGTFGTSTNVAIP